MNDRSNARAQRSGNSSEPTPVSPALSDRGAAGARPSRGGRPRKFDEPSRPITVTLPDSTLAQLARVDEDRAKAIAKAARTFVSGSGKTEPFLAEIVPIGRNAGLVVVGPSRRLLTAGAIRLVEIVPGRSILSVPSGTPAETIELTLVDLLDEVPADEPVERQLLLRLVDIFRGARRRRGMAKEEIVLVTIP